jgi:hypothetical protein
VPRDEKIPVHFLVTADELYDAAKETMRYPSIGSRRDELNSLVSLECGQRLVSLYVIVVHFLYSIRFRLCLIFGFSVDPQTIFDEKH